MKEFDVEVAKNYLYVNAELASFFAMIGSLQDFLLRDLPSLKL